MEDPLRRSGATDPLDLNVPGLAELASRAMGGTGVRRKAKALDPKATAHICIYANMQDIDIDIHIYVQGVSTVYT